MIALISPDRTARLVADDLAFPNGMHIAADGSTLIVGESYAERLTAFDIDADGSLSNRRLWADLGDGTPDGICMDADNAVWYGDVPNKRCVRVREGGEILETVELDRGCFACALEAPTARRCTWRPRSGVGRAACLTSHEPGRCWLSPHRPRAPGGRRRREFCTRGAQAREPSRCGRDP